MTDRLAPLLFLPPPINTPWTGVADQALQMQVSRADGSAKTVTSPLFWHDPNWCEMPIEQADSLAVAVGRLNTLVTAMRSELAPPDRCPVFHGGGVDVSTEDSKDEELNDSLPQEPFPRIVPYRPERYGLTASDFDHAAVIDLRLAIARDRSGRFAFSPNQIRRWEATPSGEPLAGGGWVPAATFPPDVISIKHVQRKLEQLRILSPAAAVFVSFEPYRLDEDLPRLLATNPDGIILLMSKMQLDGLSLAKLVQHARQEMNHAGRPDMPLWIVPGDVKADDVVKLIALGASAVAIDTWCEAVIEEAEQATSGHDGYQAATATQTKAIDSKYLRELAEYRLRPLIDRVLGLGFSLSRVTKAERLGSFDSTWAAELGVKQLG
tara:strand:+ start:130502 stop:131641 length:1140 start_codon:yes stop_codon:yes gene_type:complete